jgi:hypothetical protein
VYFANIMLQVNKIFLILKELYSTKVPLSSDMSLLSHTISLSIFNIFIDWKKHSRDVINVYYEFTLLHIFALVLQPWMSAYIRKTDGVYILVPKRLKHGRQNITLHWIKGTMRNIKYIFTKLNAVFILKMVAWTKKYYNG